MVRRFGPASPKLVAGTAPGGTALLGRRPPPRPPKAGLCADAVREERILWVVDRWLGTFADPDHIEETVRSILKADEHAEAEPAEVTQARHNRHRLQTELDRLIAAIRAGMDPQLAAPQTREVQSRIAAATSTIERWKRSNQRVAPLCEGDVPLVLADTADLIGLLQTADRVERGRVYQQLGLILRYEKEAATRRELVHARLQLCGGGAFN